MYSVNDVLLQLFKCFNHLGICQSISVTRKNIDLIVKESSATLEEWKEEMEAVKHFEVYNDYLHKCGKNNNFGPKFFS